MTHGSLFSGIGGFDLAAEKMGWENVFHCEWNEFGQRILKYYWPKAISYDDITKTDFSIHRGKIDILTGGFPCQPYSVAGNRKGKEDQRHLWPEMLRAIREIQPSFIVGENVSGLINWNGGMVFNEVQVDLENEGYEVQAVVLPACAVNAPHRRDRVWFVAKNTLFSRQLQRESKQERTKDGQQRNISTRDSDRICGEKRINATNPNGKPISKEAERRREISSKERQAIRSEHKAMGGTEVLTNTDCEGLQGWKNKGSITPRWKKQNEQFTRHICINWKNFPTQPPICRGNDGVPNRLDRITFSKWRRESIKAYGNAIVPQVALQIFKALIMT